MNAKSISNSLLLIAGAVILTVSSAAARPNPPPQNDRQQIQRSNRPQQGQQFGLPSNANLEEAASFPEEYRTITGVNNNLSETLWGSAQIPLVRTSYADYEDGTDSPSGSDRPSARAISNAVAAQDESIPNARGVSDMLWQWGQFLDHDIDLSPEIDPSEEFNILVPTGDQIFDPFYFGDAEIDMNRSYYEYDSEGVRQQFNDITAFIDASNVYGSDDERAADLRTNDGTGKLRTSEGDLLPYNTSGLDNAPDSGVDFFIAGDFRANEQVGLTAMHTLFVREHNHWAEYFDRRLRNADGDTIYQHARAMVTAEIQIITYRDFLPLLIGRGAIPRYRDYDPEVDASIANEFSTAAYRFGHTMLSPEVLRLDANGEVIAAGNLNLFQAFFNPEAIEDEGIEPILRGLSTQQAQEIDNKVIDDVRNLLFGAPGSPGLDLAALNIQRGRDHGLPSYNDIREAYGLKRATSFSDITSDAEVSNELASVYASVDDVDAWVGFLAEPHVNGALVGESLRTILGDQFTRLRDGDRFWYEEYLPRKMRRMAERQTLAGIIRRNTEIDRELQNNVFIAPSN